MLLFRRNKTTLKNLERFKKAKFNYAKFVHHYYMEDDKAYIMAKVDSMDDIISRFSVKGYEWLNEEFASYIDHAAYHIPVEEEIVLEIDGPQFSEAEKRTITRVITDHYGLELGESIIQLKNNTRRSAFLVLITILAATIFFALFTYTDALWLELVVVGLWFFSWEIGNVAFTHRYEIKEKKLEAGQLASIKVTFSKDVINEDKQ